MVRLLSERVRRPDSAKLPSTENAPIWRLSTRRFAVGPARSQNWPSWQANVLAPFWKAIDSVADAEDVKAKTLATAVAASNAAFMADPLRWPVAIGSRLNDTRNTPIRLLMRAAQFLSITRRRLS